MSNVSHSNIISLKRWFFLNMSIRITSIRFTRVYLDHETVIRYKNRLGWPRNCMRNDDNNIKWKITIITTIHTISLRISRLKYVYLKTFVVVMVVAENVMSYIVWFSLDLYSSIKSNRIWLVLCCGRIWTSNTHIKIYRKHLNNVLFLQWIWLVKHNCAGSFFIDRLLSNWSTFFLFNHQNYK